MRVLRVKIVAQDGTEFTTTTDANGDYKHTGLPAGRYLINISKEGVGERIGQPVVIVNGGDHFMPLKMSNKDVIILPPVHVQGKRMGVVVKERIQVLLQLIGDNLSIRYNLDHAVVKVLRQSVFEAVETAIKRDTDPHDFERAAEKSNTVLLEVLLSHPDCKNIFLEHLTETQLQDYLKFNRARQQRNLQATARQIVVLLDRELSLTADQRQSVEQLLLDTTESESFPTAMSMMIDSLNVVHLVHYKLKISLDGILTQTQSTLWHGLVKANTEEPRAIFVPLPEAGVKDVVDTAKLVNKDNTPESQERIKQIQEIAEAKLMAHTELLGPLTEDADRRLQVAAKGVVQRYMETQGEDPGAMYRETNAKLMKAVEAGEITREEAAEKLEALRGGSHITNHPLYQQAIKEVLSEDAFMQYSAHQVERENLRQQALRDRIVANLDTHLLFSEIQRKHLETVAVQLTIPLSSKDAVMEMFIQLPQHVDAEMLSPWQQREFRHIFGEFVMKK